MAMNTKEQGMVHFLIYRDRGDKKYTAVCLDFDIVEVGEDFEALRKSIEEAASLHLESVIMNDSPDKLLNRSAPQQYWKKAYEAMTAYEQFLKEQEERRNNSYSEPSVSDIWNRSSRELAVA